MTSKTSWTVNVKSFMDREHQECNRIPTAVVQRFILSRMKRCVGAWGANGVITDSV